MFRGEAQHQAIGGLISTSYTDNNGDTRTNLKLEPRYENAGEVIAKLVNLDADPQAVRAGIQAAGIPSFGSLENLVGAYSAIYRYLKDNYDNTLKLKKYWGYLANNVVFIQISTDVSSALKIFETINERGVGLNPMDLLKNLLFTQVSQAQFTQLKNEWKKITTPLERGKEKPLRFLRYFLMANYVIENDRSDAVVREDEIYDWFVNKDNAALCGYRSTPFEFVRKIIYNVDFYTYFGNGLGNDGRPSIPMDSLKRLTGGAFSLHYVMLLAAAPLPKYLFDHFVSQLESFLFYYIFTKTPTKELERNFSLWADELRAISALADSMEQRAALNGFVGKHFQRNMEAKLQELSDALKRLKLHTMQQYRTRYLLARLTQHVEMAFLGVKVAGSLSSFTGLEIEHILPNTPTTELLEQWYNDNPHALYDDYKNRMGNLTLLEKPINIVVGNDFYSGKIADYRKSGNYLTRSLAELDEVGQNSSVTRINAKLKAFPAWNATSIDDRHLVLIELAKDVWRTTPLED
jgi:hypothetical protein